MKILISFNNKKLYDSCANFSKGDPIIRREYDVLHEVIQDGATLPTYVVRCPDGSVAAIDKKMYSRTREEADLVLKQDLIDSIESTTKLIETVTEDLNNCKAALALLNEGAD